MLSGDKIDLQGTKGGGTLCMCVCVCVCVCVYLKCEQSKLLDLEVLRRDVREM